MDDEASLGTGRETVICLSSGEFERRQRAGLWAITATSVGESVQLFLVGEALRLFCLGEFDKAEGTAAASVLAERAAGLGLPKPTELLSQARELGPFRIVTCSTELALAGFNEEQARLKLDEVASLPTFWRETGSARWLTL